MKELSMAEDLNVESVLTTGRCFYEMSIRVVLTSPAYFEPGWCEYVGVEPLLQCRSSVSEN